MAGWSALELYAADGGTVTATIENVGTGLQCLFMGALVPLLVSTPIPIVRVLPSNADTRWEGHLSDSDHRPGVARAVPVRERDEGRAAALHAGAPVHPPAVLGRCRRHD